MSYMEMTLDTGNFLGYSTKAESIDTLGWNNRNSKLKISQENSSNISALFYPFIFLLKVMGLHPLIFEFHATSLGEKQISYTHSWKSLATVYSVTVSALLAMCLSLYCVDGLIGIPSEMYE
jgi:hypothetical protein